MSPSRHSRLTGIPGLSLPWRTAAGEPVARDMELIRELLFELEAGGGARPLEGWCDASIRAHLAMMLEAGLLAGRAGAGGMLAIEGLTWSGHDFLAAIRQDTIWRRLRQRLAETAGGLALESIKALAMRELAP